MGASTATPRALSGLAFATLAGVALLMGANHVAARLAFDHGTGVATAVVARSGVTAAAMGLALLLLRQGLGRASRRERMALLAVGLLVGVQSLLLYGSVARLPVALALLVFNTYPLLTAVWARVLYGASLSRSLLVAMLVLLVGLALALDVLGAASGLGMAAHWRQMGTGLAMALSGSALFGLALALTQYEAGSVDGRVRTFVTMLITALVALAGVSALGGFAWPQAAAGWWGLALLTLFYGTGITIVLVLLPRWGVVGNTAIMNLEPVFALALAWFILDQHMALLQVAGAIIVVAAVVVIGVRRE